MTAQLADGGVSSAQLRQEARQAAWATARAAFPPRPVTGDWPATHLDTSTVLGLLNGTPFALKNPGSQRGRLRGVVITVGWLADQPGSTWQQRWLASGAERAGPGWKQGCIPWLDGHGITVRQRLDLLSIGLILAVCADIIRPSVGWLAASSVSPWALARNLEHGRDPGGFTRLRTVACGDTHISAAARWATIGRAAIIVAAKGGLLSDITAGDFLELLDAEAQAQRRRDYSAVSWRMLHQLGVLGQAAPAVLAELRTSGQRSPAELIDRYRLACQPVRDLLVDYLQERQPALDYASLDQLAQHLGGRFWADIERHHPGINALHLPADAATAWKQRLRTKTTTVPTPDGGTRPARAPRLNCRQTLASVRALYLDLAQWAAEDPARWGPWAAPSPVTKADLNWRKETRHTKSRMDARTRERLPVLPVLIRSAAQRREHAEELLRAAGQTTPGATFTAAGQTLTRSVTRKPTSRVWAEDPVTRARRNLTREEDHAFWSWAIIEILRATGVRVEELLEITHHSLVQYRLPTTGELVPLLQIAPSKTDTERLLIVSPELAEVLSAIITRLQEPSGKVPLIAAYDAHEHLWLPPAPLLFQRQTGTETRRICHSTVRNLLNAALAETRLADAAGQPLRYTPHDFRRLFITDAILAGLPPHIAQVIAGHRNINITLGYKAVYPDEVIKNHLAFLARRRALRPTEEYRTPTDAEWEQFLGHFERRKVSTGLCGRAFATPCIHEHACIRCPMLWPDPAQRPRIAEIRDNLTARISEAEREGWLGEAEGLKISLAGANDKLAQIDRQARRQPVDLGIPGLPASPRPRNPVQA
jgi:site-specific recombinase XerD